MHFNYFADDNALEHHDLDLTMDNRFEKNAVYVKQLGILDRYILKIVSKSVDNFCSAEGLKFGHVPISQHYLWNAWWQRYETWDTFECIDIVSTYTELEVTPVPMIYVSSVKIANLQ